MVEQMVENIRTSENLSPNELERLRSMLPEGWAANNRQTGKQGGMTQLEVILDAIDYIKTLQEKLNGGRKWKGQGLNIEGCDWKKERVI